MMTDTTQTSKLITQDSSLSTIVLAAGESRRMGALGPKQLLPWRDGRTMLQAVIDNLAATALPLHEVIVVLGSSAGEIVPTLSKAQWPALPLRVVVNENWAAGMLGSVQRGLAMAAPAAGYLILLGDQPALAPFTIHTVAAAFLTDPTRPTLPIIAGIEGHPLILPPALRDNVIAARVDTPGGLRALLDNNILRVEVADPDASWDINTLEEYNHWRSRAGRTTARPNDF